MDGGPHEGSRFPSLVHLARFDLVPLVKQHTVILPTGQDASCQ